MTWQHVKQFWLHFAGIVQINTVTLSFGSVPHPIVIPFAAIRTFADPSVNFGLKFDAHETAAGAEKDEPTQPPQPRDPAPVKPAGDGEVVSLDKFRKH